MNIIQCVSCHSAIYKLKHSPVPGLAIQSDSFEDIYSSQCLSPKPLTPMLCPVCGRFPFIYHNTGIQMLTIEGELIP
jgi:hypothetical protein